jgi:hypothetical protein
VQQQQQRRFRAKQKNMVATLKTRLAELEDLVHTGSSAVFFFFF